MALLFFDGFDHIGTTASLMAAKWASELATGLGTPGRTGSAFLNCNSSGVNAVTRPFPGHAVGIIGVAFRLNGPSPSTVDIFQFKEGGTVHAALQVNSDRTVSVKRGSTVLQTSTAVLPASAWTYVEMKVTISDTVGTYEVRFDGVTVLGPAINQDMQNAGTAKWDRVQVNGNTGAAHHYDDLYLCDGSGASHTDFLGPVKIETLLPQIGNGSNVGLTPSTGTDHGALVDENPPNTTDYNASATVGVKDTYNYPSMALTGTILGIQTNLYAAKSDTGARSVCAVVRAGGTDYDGANAAPGTTFSYLTEIRTVNPNTGVAWTPADIAALEAGMKVTA